MKLYKYRNCSDRDIQTLINYQIFSSSKKELNDPCEFQTNDEEIQNLKRSSLFSTYDYDKIRTEILRIEDILKNSFGVYSLSKDVNSQPLWAHYSNHTGFCIEYDSEILLTALKKNKAICLDVNYINSIPSVSIDTLWGAHSNFKKLVQLFLGHKCKSWEYEKEVRFVQMKMGLINISKESITAIYFGIKTSEETKNMIIKNMNGISFYQMKLNPNSYLLEAELITCPKCGTKFKMEE